MAAGGALGDVIIFLLSAALLEMNRQYLARLLHRHHVRYSTADATDRPRHLIDVENVRQRLPAARRPAGDARVVVHGLHLCGSDKTPAPMQMHRRRTNT
ncbi:MAG: hypothetical protein ACLRMJ_06080 [Alistipes finegoldii]